MWLVFCGVERCVTKCAIAIVYLSRQKFLRGDQKVEKSKNIKGVAFYVLCARRSDLK